MHNTCYFDKKIDQEIRESFEAKSSFLSFNVLSLSVFVFWCCVDVGVVCKCLGEWVCSLDQLPSDEFLVEM